MRCCGVGVAYGGIRVAVRRRPVWRLGRKLFSYSHLERLFFMVLILGLTGLGDEAA